MDNNMDFEEISKMAYKKEKLSRSNSILEQLVWYKMKEVYEDYNKGKYDFNQSQVNKGKVESFYLQQMRLNKFYEDLKEERYKHIRESEDILKNILKAEQNKVSEKELTEMLIDYIVEITGNVPIKTEYKKNYTKSID